MAGIYKFRIGGLPPHPSYFVALRSGHTSGRFSCWVVYRPVCPDALQKTVLFRLQTNRKIGRHRVLQISLAREETDGVIPARACLTALCVTSRALSIGSPFDFVCLLVLGQIRRDFGPICGKQTRQEWRRASASGKLSLFLLILSSEVRLSDVPMQPAVSDLLMSTFGRK